MRGVGSHSGATNGRALFPHSAGWAVGVRGMAGQLQYLDTAARAHPAAPKPGIRACSDMSQEITASRHIHRAKSGQPLRGSLQYGSAPVILLIGLSSRCADVDPLNARSDWVTLRELARPPSWS